MQGSRRWAVIDTGLADPHLHGLIVTTTRDHAHSRRVQGWFHLVAVERTLPLRQCCKIRE
jgi:hypothetical protein